MRLTPVEAEKQIICEHCKVRLATKKIWLRTLWKFYCDSCWK